MTTKDERGFSLVEALVASAILAGSLAVLLPMFATAVERGHAGRDQATAALHTESLLARLGADIPCELGEQVGVLAEGYRWRLTVSPHGAGGQTAPTRFVLRDVRLEVAWGALPTQAIQLSTMRLVEAK